MRAVIFAACCWLSASVTPALAQSAPNGAVDPCDRTAGHPSDPNRVGPGVATDDVVTHLAIPACRAAVEREPDNPRFHYQLGRALYYWAGANDGDAAEAVLHIQRAADLGYGQAQFVRGLLHKYSGDLCAAAPLLRDAADQALKSARLTYVDDVTAGAYDDCGESATRDALQAYLDGAAEQVDGYYEGMLLAALERRLAAWGE